MSRARSLGVGWRYDGSVELLCDATQVGEHFGARVGLARSSLDVKCASLIIYENA